MIGCFWRWSIATQILRYQRRKLHAPGSISVHCGISPGKPGTRALRSRAECSDDWATVAWLHMSCNNSERIQKYRKRLRKLCASLFKSEHIFPPISELHDYQWVIFFSFCTIPLFLLSFFFINIKFSLSISSGTRKFFYALLIMLLFKWIT